jgi:hypothetical protein
LQTGSDLRSGPRAPQSVLPGWVQRGSSVRNHNPFQYWSAVAGSGTLNSECLGSVRAARTTGTMRSRAGSADTGFWT